MPCCCGTCGGHRNWVFDNGMSDLFHAKVPVEFIQQVLAVMEDTPQHTYQVLTKRAHRLRWMAARLKFPPNAWIGGSVESAEHLDRVEGLRAIPAAVRFLSREPLPGAADRAGPDGDPLVDRWRRVRAAAPPDGPGVGQGEP